MTSKSLKRQKPARRSAVPDLTEAAKRAPHLVYPPRPKTIPDGLASQIAAEHLGPEFAILTARGRDALDFHDASVVGVRDLIQAAYNAGRSDAIVDLTSSPAPSAIAGKHTPGPWAVSDRRTMKGNMIPVGGDDASAPVFANALYDEAEANARLIAAAPDLLAAAYITSTCSPVERDLALMADDTEITLTFCAADLRQIRAAIAKAVRS